MELSMSPDEQEARWRKYSDDRIILLPLKSGAVAIFNNAAEFCDIMYLDDPTVRGCMEDIIAHWRRPSKREAKPRPTLEELGL
jgi:hypothetical protein